MALISLKQNFKTIPGFGMTLGYTLTFLSLVVLIPLLSLFLYSTQLSLQEWWKLITGKQFILALSLSLTTALTSAILNSFLGLLLAWVLVRYQFLGKKLLIVVSICHSLYQRLSRGLH